MRQRSALRGCIFRAVVIALLATQSHADLIAYWDLNDSDGGIAADMCGANDGVLLGDPLWQEGPAGSALSFDGLDDRVLIRDDPTFRFSREMTISAWIKTDPFDAQRLWQTIVAKGEHSWRLQRLRATRGIEFSCGDYLRGWEGVLAGNIVVDDGLWHHVAGTNDGRMLTLYLDGILVARHATTAHPAVQISDAPICIGANSDQVDRTWDGLIDEVALFDHALSPAEIEQLWTQGVPSFLSSQRQAWNRQLQEAKRLLRLGAFRQAATYIGKQIEARDAMSRAGRDSDPADRGRFLAEMHFLLGESTKGSDRRVQETASAYRQALSGPLRPTNARQALSWLFDNVSPQELRACIKQGLMHGSISPSTISRVASWFAADGHWPPFEAFLEGVFLQVDDPTSYAGAVADGLSDQETWRDRFVAYAHRSERLRAYVFHVYDREARTLTLQGDFTAAAEIYRQALDRCRGEEESGRYRLRVLECQFMQGAYSQVIEQLDALLTEAPATGSDARAGALLLKGQIELQRGEHERAMERFAEILKERPASRFLAQAQFFLGYVHYLEGAQDEAEKMLRATLEAYPESLFASKAGLCLNQLEQDKILSRANATPGRTLP